MKKGHKDKRVLLVITDGDDDASRKDFAYTVKAAVESNAVIYAIGVFSDEDRKNQKKMVRKSKKELTTLAESTGGLAFFPDRLEDGWIRFACRWRGDRHSGTNIRWDITPTDTRLRMGRFAA